MTNYQVQIQTGAQIFETITIVAASFKQAIDKASEQGIVISVNVAQ